MIAEETIPNPIPIGRILIVDNKSLHLSREAIGINRLVVTEGSKVMRAHPIDGRVLVSDAVTSSGDGGGPLFGFWDEGPAIIGISSRLSPAPIPIPTLAGGGDEMVELVRKAIEQRP